MINSTTRILISYITSDIILQIEWMSEKLTKAFDSLRTNPFSFKHLKFCHNLTDLSRLPSPKVMYGAAHNEGTSW